LVHYFSYSKRLFDIILNFEFEFLWRVLKDSKENSWALKVKVVSSLVSSLQNMKQENCDDGDWRWEITPRGAYYTAPSMGPSIGMITTSVTSNE
jgi:hypothetical protein